MIRTRFAPSPTGWLHIGGVRTALYAWLFAKRNSGEFYIRIDDTDTTRSTREYCESIINSLGILGIQSDMELLYQSSRFDKYIDSIEKLLSANMAYYDKVEVNEKTKDTNLEIQYKNKLNRDGHVIRFRNPDKKSIVIDDIIHGSITFENKSFHDVVILRSNGVPTYNLTSVVDDIHMNISHIIRGDDHLSNTPVQANLFEALGADIPSFAHLPMIHGVDGKRLSKRHGAVDINTFLKDGYLVEALINYLVKTGWSHGDEEFFTIDQLKDLFSLDKVTKSSAIFDYDKLNWVNQHYIKKMDISDVCELIIPYLQSNNIIVEDKNYLKSILSLGIDRDYNLKNIAKGLDYFFINNLDYSNDELKKVNQVLAKDILTLASDNLSKIEFNSKEEISSIIKDVCNQLDLKFKDVGPIIRFALTSKLKAPSIDELCFVLGKQKTLDRIKSFVEFIE